LVVLAYNQDVVEKHIDPKWWNSWGLIYEPENIKKLKSCGVTLLEDNTDVIFTAYLYKGKDLGDGRLQTLKEVSAELQQLRPSIKRFDISQSAEQLAGGEICMAQQWMDHLLFALDKFKNVPNHPRIKVILPQEGALMWIDTLASPVDAPHKENAYKLLDFLLRPEIAAQVSNILFSPTAIKRAREFQEPHIRNNPLIYPDETYMKKVRVAAVKSLRFQRHLTRAFSQLVTGH
jgi:putrescine transport system substrate-binding protein